MENNFLTLDEAARILKKSTQTIRRMIKKGELVAQRVRTPQGFHYVLKREDIVLSDSPIQKSQKAETVAENSVLTNQNENPTSQTLVEPFVKPISRAVDKIPSQTPPPTVFYFPPLPSSPSVDSKDLLRLIERQHREQLELIRILGRLQEELLEERGKKPTGLFSGFFKRIFGRLA
jgi:excisionase family DNA binding protein